MKHPKITSLITGLLFATPLFAQNMDITRDAGFASNGFFTYSQANFRNLGYDLALQPDGKILVVSEKNPTGGFSVIRLNANGTLDNTFGTNGEATHFFDLNDADEGRALALQPDGKILLAGSTFRNATNSRDFGIIRLLANGTLDNGFGQNGKASFHLEGADIANDLALQPDGKILVMGTAYFQNFAVGRVKIIRLNTNGTLDNSFGNGGIFTSESPSPTAKREGLGMALMADGKIVVVGRDDQNGIGTGPGFLAIRVKANGVADSTFNNNGVAIKRFANYVDHNGFNVRLNSDGSMVVAGEVTDADGSYCSLAKIKNDGSTDANFGTGGIAVHHLGNPVISINNFRDLEILSSGKILAVGETTENGGQCLVLAQFNANGSLDNNFGNGGFRRFPNGSNPVTPRAMRIDNNGKVMVAGQRNEFLWQGSSDASYFVGRFVIGPSTAVSELETNNRENLVNPSNGYELAIKTKLPHAEMHYQLFSVQGRQLENGQFDGQGKAHLLNRLPAGIYWVRLFHAQHFWGQKLLVE